MGTGWRDGTRGSMDLATSCRCPGQHPSSPPQGLTSPGGALAGPAGSAAPPIPLVSSGCEWQSQLLCQPSPGPPAGADITASLISSSQAPAVWGTRAPREAVGLFWACPLQGHLCPPRGANQHSRLHRRTGAQAEARWLFQGLASVSLSSSQRGRECRRLARTGASQPLEDPRKGSKEGSREASSAPSSSGPPSPGPSSSPFCP